MSKNNLQQPLMAPPFSIAKSGEVSQRAFRIFGRWAGPAVITVVSLIMIIWQWRAWPDPYVDFGRELYVPWQLSLGKMLYTDIAYFNGPLSPYFNALVFRLFGVSLTTLIFTNLILTALITLLLYRLILRVANRFTAAFAGVTFAALFGYGNILTCGNYNFICPYSHEVTHGILLALIAITFLDRYWRYQKAVDLVVTGLSLGLCFLTKSECFLAAFVTVILPSCLLSLRRRTAFTRVTRTRLMIVLAAAALPVLIAWALLSCRMSCSQAFRAVIGTWSWISNDQMTSLPFYKWVMGLDRPAERFSMIARWTGIYCMFLLPAAILARLIPHKRKIRRYIVAATVLILLSLILIPMTPKFVIYYPQFVKPVPFILLSALTVAIIVFFKKRDSLHHSSRSMLSIALLTFAVTLLLKFFFNCRISHYGFALAMPATLMTIVLLIHWIPDGITHRGGSGIVFQSVIIALLAVFILCEIKVMRYRLDKKTVTVSAGHDRLRADIKGDYLNTLLDYISSAIQPDQTLAALPEGVIVNYLSRRANPTPYINFMPPELIIFGEDTIIDAFDRTPPDYIALIHKNTEKYGCPFFGVHYGQKLHNWVIHHYSLVLQIGAAPLQDDRFGIVLLKRNPPVP